MPRKLFGLLISQGIPREYNDEFNVEVNGFNYLRQSAILKILIIVQLIAFPITAYFGHRLGSSLYIVMSVISIVMSIIFLYALKAVKGRMRQYIDFIMLFLLVLWSAGYALSDKSSFGLTAVYVGVVLLLSVLYLGPKKIIAATLLAHIFFIIGYLNLNSDMESVIANWIISSIFVVVSWVISGWLYANYVHNFATKKMIQSKNAELEVAKTRMEERASYLQETHDKIKRLLDLRDDILEVNQQIIGSHNMEEIYRYILDKAIKNIEGANVGSILHVMPNGYLKPVAFKGYDPEKMKKFNLKLSQSFIWKKTNGKIKKSVVIGDLDELRGIRVIDTVDEKENWQIKSSLVAPIIINGKVYGLIHMDSRNKNAFTDDDLELIEYFRGQIEIAITKQKLYEETRYLSRYDKVTDLYNRRYFEELFYLCIDKAAKNNEKLSIVVMDLNGLKYINDNYGHLAGDRYISEFAYRLKSSVRNSDIIARIGGDEFGAIFPTIDTGSLVMRFEKLLDTFNENEIVFEGNKFKCSFSYGISEFPGDGKTFKELIKEADENMYKYKREHKKV